MYAEVWMALFAVAGVALILIARDRLLHRIEWRTRPGNLRDRLTDLPGRDMVKELISSLLANAAGRSVAVLFVDLDRFKAVNESFGHSAGDLVLRETARRLRKFVRDEEVVGRISSDEFVVVLPRLERAEQAAAVAREILAELRRPFDLGGRPVY